jgi:SAM-dependent methyltransferase
MLDRATRRQGPDHRISWQQADALNLPFADASFDVVCCQFGVMFFPDRVAGYREALRVLGPRGTLIFNAWDRIEDNEFSHVVTEAAASLFPNDPPLFLARTPHGYHDVTKIASDLREAGFFDIHIETLAQTSAAPSARHPAVAYCQGTPLRNEIEARDPGSLERVTAHAAQALARLYGEGAVSAKIQAHIIVART